MPSALRTLATQRAHRMSLQEHQDTRYIQRIHHGLLDRELCIGGNHQCAV